MSILIRVKTIERTEAAERQKRGRKRVRERDSLRNGMKENQKTREPSSPSEAQDIKRKKHRL